MVREAATLALPVHAITSFEFDAWLETHDAVLRAKLLKQTAEDLKAAGFPVHPDWWLKKQAGNVDQTFGDDFL